MPLRANDDMVMDADAQPLAGLDDLAGDLDILLARGRIARWMIMHLSAFSKIGILINMLQQGAVGVEPLIGVCNSPRLVENSVCPCRSRKGPDLHADA